MEELKCPKCGAVLDNPEQQFCGGCGFKLDSAFVRVCPICGKVSTDPKRKFCNDCGSALEIRTVDSKQGNVPERIKPNMGESMGWFHFMTKGLLIANVLSYILVGIGLILQASMLSDKSKQVIFGMPRKNPGKTALIVLAVFAFLIGIYALIVRHRLAKLKQGAPEMLTIMYVAMILFNFALAIIMPKALNEPVNIGTVISAIAVPLVLLIINKKYFDNRAYMF